jgi:hypothetical protein
MKKFISIITFLLITGFNILHCQTTKFLITYYPNTRLIKDSTSVLIDNPKIKHGRYISFYKKPKNSEYYIFSLIKIEGFYFNNIKDSIWREYSEPLKHQYPLDKEEHYNKGEKVGIWKTRVEEFVYERFDYNKNVKLFPIIEKERPEYPSEAMDKMITGKVKLRVRYNDDYSIKSIESLISVDSILLKPMIEIAKRKSGYLRKYAIEFKDTVISEEILK